MMTKKRINLFSIPIDALTMQETLEVVGNAIDTKKQLHHTVVNAGKIVLMQDDPELFKSVCEADLINADGQAVVWAAKLLGQKLPERVTGIDLMENLVAYAADKRYKVFFLGAAEDVLTSVVSIYSKKYSREIVAGYHHGYFKKEEERKIANLISNSKPQILFVAMSSPKKEIFLHNYKSLFRNVNFVMGVGGSFDVIAGRVKRAPIWMQFFGLEWLYRLIQEPRRMWKRYTVGNMRFIGLVIREIFNGK